MSSVNPCVLHAKAASPRTWRTGTSCGACAGKITGKESGFTWYSMLPEESMEYSMQYKVKFMDGFDWTRGGKLPGLCGGGARTPLTLCLCHSTGRMRCWRVTSAYRRCADGGGRGSFCPVGCSKVSKDRGFSMRLMWRQDGAIATYAYYPDKPDSVHCGEDWLWSKKLRAGKWHTIRMYAKLNTVTGDDAKEDGVFKAYLDGKLVLEKTGIRYRYDEKFLISRAYITTYVGGSSRKLFAPQQDQHVWCAHDCTWPPALPPACPRSACLVSNPERRAGVVCCAS